METVVLRELPSQATEEGDGKEIQKSPIKQLGFIDRYLSIWILIMMAAGTLVGIYSPNVRDTIDKQKVANVSIFVFVGLLLMLYPVFCKVNYEKINQVFSQPNAAVYVAFTIVMNWIICPFIMTALAWATLFDLEDYRIGVLLIGIARCIAMVLIWNDLAGGNQEWCAIIVAINSVLQVILFSPMALLFTGIIGGGSMNPISFIFVFKTVLIYLGIPFATGLLTRLCLRRASSQAWYDEKFIPSVSPIALLGLLYTIFIMFALQGHQIIDQIVPVIRVVIPLTLYFILVWFFTMFVCYLWGFEFDMAITQSYTAASNNFELAMAVAVATYGIDSHYALATAVGPLVEVPVLLSLVYLCPIVEKRYKKL